MKRKLTLIFLLAAPLFAFAVDPSKAVEHMLFLSAQEEQLSEKYMSYLSEVAHGQRARKMEKRRQEVIVQVRTAIREGGKLKPFEGDASLRNAYVTYWNVVLSILNEDYHKIMDMEEIAERSYDAMEAYLLMQEKAGEKMNEAYDRLTVTYRAFAASHNVTLTEGTTSKLSRKLGEAGKVNGYLNQIFLIEFKSAVQEANMIDALNKHDINALEQSKSAMIKYADEGLQKLDTVKTFKNDGTLIAACRKVLEFHKSEGAKANALSEFLMKADEFEKTRKAFESKPASTRKQADIDAYNKSIDTYNKALTASNKINAELNKNRTAVLDNWDATKKRFLDRYVPHK